ncbi:acyl-homoserine-lactone acylase [Variovorax boronicumulans]|uniref:Acyl-homoserine-lactone acylase n=1 Tax=Variovorax boronicumulans TaxID=436515 RepID=A0AAW8D058_9BURK|nr:penicillin acylase family protein [Variovorax boronicumulans]MDP9896998.1 acyl-homoserine-lactone acylase [Variovorax boronicumulans]MDQ0057038.1 acyl-homoserine-lactone acylase [Variovorax boronicumulans]
MKTIPRPGGRAWRRGIAAVALAATLTATLIGTAPAWARREGQPATASIEIRRTGDGIPHVRATTWRGLGIGYGQVQAEDALCTLADAFVTYSGQRSLYFGADRKPAKRSTFGMPVNLDLDFFFKAFAGPDAVEALKREQPADLDELIAGYAEGYNRHVRSLQKSRGKGARHACSDAPWVRTIEPDDVYRRMIAAALAGGYAHFVSEIVNAKPAATAPPVSSDHLSLSSRLEIPVGDARGIGSNVLAFGQAATGERGGSVLFGNPHWYWGGPDRFYQAHLTLPGKMDVAGVSFLGIPVIMIGFNNDVAWSHTVSAARRFGLFDLVLDPADPTRYLVDGVSERMQARPVDVEVRRPDGTFEAVHRTLYRTRFGPVVDLGARNPALGWSARKAIAMRDVNASNARIFPNFFRWGQARSLDEFIQIQKQEAAMPWVNTAAIGRGDGRVWYADIGAVPAVPDDLRAACATPLSKAFAAIDADAPVLDGSRSACEWKAGQASEQPRRMPPDHMPSLLREDYVANMNDSYWLTNPAQPLTGFASILGGEGQALSMRGREGHRIASELSNAGSTSSRQLAERVMQKTQEARSYTADQFKQPLLDAACAASGQVGPTPDMRQACRILRNWSNRAGAQDRGALLWDAFWTRLQQIPAGELYAKAFSAEAPLRTPAAINAADPRVASALAGAVDDMRQKGRALDAPLGTLRFARSEGRRIPLFGGCDAEGYFTIACANEGDYTMGDRSHGNTYLQVVYFDRRGVHARTLLAHGEKETAVTNGLGAAPVVRYAKKDWLRFPFHEEDIARDPALVRQTLRP